MYLLYTNLFRYSSINNRPSNIVNDDIIGEIHVDVKSSDDISEINFILCDVIPPDIESLVMVSLYIERWAMGVTENHVIGDIAVDRFGKSARFSRNIYTTSGIAEKVVRNG